MAVHASDAPKAAAKAGGQVVSAAQPPAGHQAGSDHGHPARATWGRPAPDSPLAVDLKLFVLTLVLFLGLLYFLTHSVWRPYQEALAEREGRMAAALRDAELARAEAKEILARTDRELGAAHAEVRKLLDQARGEAQQEADQLLAQAKSELQAERDAGMAGVAAAKKQALAELEATSGDLAGRIVGRLLGREGKS